MSFTGRAPRAVLLRFKRIASKPCEHSPLRSLAQRPPRCIRRALRLGEIRRHWQPGRRAWTHPPRHQLRILILGSLRQAPPWLAYYDPAPWRWVRAVRVRHIIGRLSLIGLLLWPVTLIYTLWCVPDRAPLMKCYLDSKDTGTTPSHLAKYREQYLIMAMQTMGDSWAASFRSSTHLPGNVVWYFLWTNNIVYYITIIVYNIVCNY